MPMLAVTLLASLLLLVPQYRNLELAALSIKTFDSSRNEIGDDDVTALAKAISWNECSSRGFAEIAFCTFQC